MASTPLLSVRTIEAIAVLTYSCEELQSWVQQAFEENPFLDPADSHAAEFFLSPTPSDDRPTHRRTAEQLADDLPREPAAPAIAGEHLSQSVSQYIHFQIETAGWPRHERTAVTHLATFLDSDGYLTGHPDEWKEALRGTSVDLDRAISLLQSLDPAGIGARSPRECLELQIRRLRSEGLFPPDLIRNAEELLRSFDRLDDHQAWRIEIDGIDSLLPALPSSPRSSRQDSGTGVLNLFRRLTLRPLLGVDAPAGATSVRPDIIVQRTAHGTLIQLSAESDPRLLLNRHYLSLRHHTTDPNLKRYLDDRYRHALWILRALGHRRSTLIRIARSLVAHHAAFLLEGKEPLRPVTMAQVAQEVGVSVSTVSRAVTGKYIAAPKGVYPLRSLFASAAPAEQTRSELVEAIKEILRTESARSPLSDQAIASRLQDMGYPTARRTVTKYRRLLGIPPAGKRKKK